jgi:hypothetical protein
MLTRLTRLVEQAADLMPCTSAGITPNSRMIDYSVLSLFIEFT